MRKAFVRLLKILQIKEEGSNFWKELIFQNVRINWSPHLYFNFKTFLDPNSWPFIRFHWILYDSGVLLSWSSNFYKLKRADLTSVGNKFCRISEFFGLPFCISILKVLWTQILRHSLDLSPFCMNEEDFSQSAEISTNSRGGDLISGGREAILQNVWIIWSPLPYFNFKSFQDPNSSSFIAFQCILPDSGVPF